MLLLLLLLLSRFSRVWLCATPETEAHQAPLSLGFSRQEHWVAISFSNAWKSKVKVKLLSCVQVLATPWTAAYQASPSLGFSRQEYWSGLPLPSLKMKSSCTKVSETQKQGEVRPSDKLFTVSSELQGYRHTSHTAGCGWGTPRWYNLT